MMQDFNRKLFVASCTYGPRMSEESGAEAGQGREALSRLSHNVRQCHLANEEPLSPLVKVAEFGLLEGQSNPSQYGSDI